MSVLVTGASGAVGRYVTRALLDAGFAVIGLSRGHRAELQHANFQHYQADIVDTASVLRVFERHAVSVVVHLAAIVHVRDASLTLADYVRVNHEASLALFEAAVQNGVQRIVFASSIEVYGVTEPGSCVDERHTCRPQSDYARSKLLAEQALIELATRCPIRYAILRLAPVYSLEFRSNLDKRLYLRRPFAYRVGAGDYRLALCSARNIEHFVVRWLAQPEPSSGVFNLSDDQSYAAIDLLERERRAGRCRVTLQLPYQPLLFATALAQQLSAWSGRSQGLVTADNVRKLVRSASWDTRRARAVVGSLPWNIDNTLYAGEAGTSYAN